MSVVFRLELPLLMITESPTSSPAVPAQRRGKILRYRFVLSNGGVPGLEIRRVGWGSDAGCY